MNAGERECLLLLFDETQYGNLASKILCCHKNNIVQYEIQINSSKQNIKINDELRK